MATLHFDLNTLAFLSLRQYPQSGYTHIGLAEFEEISSVIESWPNYEQLTFGWIRLIQLLEAVKSAQIPGQEFDGSGLIGVLTNNGALTKVYGPKLYRGEEPNDKTLVLKAGKNLFEVKQEGTQLSCGPLKGSLNFQQAQNARGEYRTDVFWALRLPGEFDTYLIPCGINTDTRADQGVLQGSMEMGLPIYPYFLPPMTQAVRMQDLGRGEWLVKKIQPVQVERNGTLCEAYIIHLVDAPPVWARGTAEKLICGGFVLPKNQPITLAITGIEECDTGVTVHNAFYPRPPRTVKISGTPSSPNPTPPSIPQHPKLQVLPPSARSDFAAKVTQKRSSLQEIPVSAVMSLGNYSEDDLNLDDIPFRRPVSHKTNKNLYDCWEVEPNFSGKWLPGTRDLFL